MSFGVSLRGQRSARQFEVFGFSGLTSKGTNVVPLWRRVMVGSFTRVMNFVNAGGKGGRTLMPFYGSRHITRAVREDAPRKTSVF